MRRTRVDEACSPRNFRACSRSDFWSAEKSKFMARGSYQRRLPCAPVSFTIGASPLTLPSPRRGEGERTEADMRATAAGLYEGKKPVAVEDGEGVEPGPPEGLEGWAANGGGHSDLHAITGADAHP